RKLACTPATLSRQQFVIVTTGTQDDWLNDARFGYRGSQLGKSGVVESPSRLPGTRPDPVERNVLHGLCFTLPGPISWRHFHHHMRARLRRISSLRSTRTIIM